MKRNEVSTSALQAYQKIQHIKKTLLIKKHQILKNSVLRKETGLTFFDASFNADVSDRNNGFVSCRYKLNLYALGRLACEVGSDGSLYCWLLNFLQVHTISDVPKPFKSIYHASWGLNITNSHLFFGHCGVVGRYYGKDDFFYVLSGDGDLSDW